MYINSRYPKIIDEYIQIIRIHPKKIDGMFYECYSLMSLPDISKWNTNYIEDMRSIFYYCKSLSSLPDISKWNNSNLLFYHGHFLHFCVINALIENKL